MIAIAIVVDHCANCPFCAAPTEADAPDEPWLCDALGAADGNTEPRELPEQQPIPGQWADPPGWCPLRDADRLVTLRRRAGS